MEWAAGTICPPNTLNQLGFLDGEEKAWRLHDWQQHNSWAAQASDRGDKARLSRLARKHPEIVKQLKQLGIEGITAQDYQDINSTVVLPPQYDRVRNATTPSPAPAPTYVNEEGVCSRAGAHDEAADPAQPPPPSPRRPTAHPRAIPSGQRSCLAGPTRSSRGRKRLSGNGCSFMITGGLLPSRHPQYKTVFFCDEHCR